MMFYLLFCCFDPLLQILLVRSLMLAYQFYFDLTRLVVFSVFQQLVQEVNSLLHFQLLGLRTSFQCHVVRLLGSKNQLNITEIIPVYVYSSYATQLGIESQHAECDIFLTWYFKPFAQVVGLLLGSEDAEVSGSHIDDNHFKISLADDLEGVEDVLFTELVYQLNRVDRIQLKCADSGDVVNVMCLFQVSQKLGYLALNMFQIDSVVPVFSAYIIWECTDDIREEIAAIIDAGLEQVVADVHSGGSEGVIFAKQEHKLNAVVISGEGVEVGGVGDGKLDEGESVHTFDIYQSLHFHDLVVDVLHHGGVIITYCQLGLKRLLQSLHAVLIIKFNYIIMQDIREAIFDLIAGYAKQATCTIDMLINSHQNFFHHLTALILGINTQPLRAKALTAGIVTLNTAAVRLSKKCQAKDFLIVEEIYGQLKTIMCSGAVDFENKKHLHPALTEMMGSLCSNHKEMVELKEMMRKGEDRRSTLIIVSAIISNKTLGKHVKIQCITEMFQIMMEEIICYRPIFTTILTSSNSRQTEGIVEIPRNGWIERTKFEDCISRIKYCIDLLYTVFSEIFETIDQAYEYQALLLLSSDPCLSELIYLTIQWQNPSGQQSPWIPWVQDFKYGPTVCEFYEVNNLKQKAFRILSTILHKTSGGYNFYHSSNQLLSGVPQLCKRVVLQIMKIGTSFQQLDEDYLIGAICDSMLQFMGQTLRFNDLLIIYAENVSLDELIICLPMYLRIRDSDISNMEGEYFCHFLEGFAGAINFNQITRYSISEFIEACCTKFDSFPAKMFNYCFHGILGCLHRRLTNQSLNIDQDCYQHLYLTSENSDCIEILEGKELEMECCLLGFVALQKQIQTRADFKSALSEFLIVMDYSHFKKEELVIIYYLMGTHVSLFQEQGLLQVLDTIINQAINLAEADSHCSILYFQFIKRLYIQFLTPQPLNHPLSQKYIEICSKSIWPQLMRGFNLPTTSQNEYFWETVRDLIAVPNLQCYWNEDQTDKQPSSLQMWSKKQKKKKKVTKIERVGQYLMTQISLILLAILKQSCEKEQLLLKQLQDTQIGERMHQLILQCIRSLCWVNQLNADVQINNVQFHEYVSVVETLINNLATSVNFSSTQCSNGELSQNCMEILSTLIGQEQQYYPVDKPSLSPITSQPFQALLPAMLNHPFTQHWLVCICEFTHRIQGKYKLSEWERILQIIKLAYTQHIDNQNQLNEASLFAIVLLNYEQPENWCALHEIVRVNLVKFMKIEAVSDKGERKRKIRQLGFESQNIFGISILRLFHVYLFGFRMEPIHELMSEILEQIEKFIDRYTVVETSHLIIGLKSSYKSMSQQNWNKVLNIILVVLNKLMLNNSYYGNQSHEQSAIRRLSQKIGCLGIDPYQQFRQLVRLVQNEGVILSEDQKYGAQIRSMMNIVTKQGQPRKLYSILRPKG